jgi:hypothetical protein
MATNVIIKDHSDLLMKAIYEKIVAAQADEWVKPDQHPSSTFWTPLESPQRKKFELYPVASSYIKEATNVSIDVRDEVINLFVLNTDGSRSKVPAAQIGVKYPSGKLVDIWIGLSSTKFDEKIRGEYYYL